MTGYLQRLVDTTPGILPALPEPVVRSQSPIAQSDQRLAFDPLAQALGEISTDITAAPALSQPATPVAQPAARAMPTAPTPPPPRAAPIAVQRFQASSPAAVAAPPAASAAAPPAARAAPVAPLAAPPAAKTPAQPGPLPQPPVARPDLAPPSSPVTIVNTFTQAPAPSQPQSRAEAKTAPKQESRAPANPAAPSPQQPATSAKLEKTAARVPDELVYVSPAERKFDVLLPLPRPERDVAESLRPAPAPGAASAAPQPPQRIAAREIRETIREIVREVASAAPPPREAARMPKTAAEASVIGPLGSPYAAARRLALMLR